MKKHQCNSISQKGGWRRIGSLRRLIVHLKLWKWAAVHHADFKYFEISYSKMFTISTSKPLSPLHLLSINIGFHKPRFYLFEPTLAVDDFCREHCLAERDLYPEIIIE